jgi:hypothetical protein
MADQIKVVLGVGVPAVRAVRILISIWMRIVAADGSRNLWWGAFAPSRADRRPRISWDCVNDLKESLQSHTI